MTTLAPERGNLMFYYSMCVHVSVCLKRLMSSMMTLAPAPIGVFTIMKLIYELTSGKTSLNVCALSVLD